MLYGKPDARKFLRQKRSLFAEMIMKVWLEIFYTLRGQINAIMGSADNGIEKRLAFNKFGNIYIPKWGNTMPICFTKLAIYIFLFYSARTP